MTQRFEKDDVVQPGCLNPEKVDNSKRSLFKQFLESIVCDENKKLKPYSVKTNNCQTFVKEFLEKARLGDKDLFFRENEWRESLRSAPSIYTKDRIKSDF